MLYALIGLYFLSQDNITNFQNEWLEDPTTLIGKVVIVQGQALLHNQNRQDILTDGKEVKIRNYMPDKQLWAADSPDLEMYDYYSIGAGNFKKTE